MNHFLFGQSNWKAIRIAFFGVFILLIVLAFVPAPGHNHQRPPIVRSQGQIRSLIQGAFLHALYHEDYLPTKEQWPGALIESGIFEKELLVSAAEDGDGISFIYLPSAEKIFEGDYQNRIVIYEDPKHYEQGVVVGFADVRVEIIKHELFETMLADQHAAQTTAP